MTANEWERLARECASSVEKLKVQEFIERFTDTDTWPLEVPTND